MCRRQQDPRPSDRGTTRRSEQDIRRHHHDERVHVEFVEAIAQMVEIVLRTHGLANHRHGDEQAARPCSSFNRLQGLHLAMELVASHNHADDAGTARCEGSRGIAGAIAEPLDGLAHTIARVN